MVAETVTRLRVTWAPAFVHKVKVNKAGKETQYSKEMLLKYQLAGVFDASQWSNYLQTAKIGLGGLAVT